MKVSAVMLGVEDVARAKAFYGDGLGCRLDQDHPHFVSFNLDGGTTLAIYQRDAAAQDAGVSAKGSGYRGVSFHMFVPANDDVDRVIGQAVAAGGTVVKPAEAAQWGGYSGYFGDPDGYLWKVVAS